MHLRVLVVDDDEEDFLILRDLLADFPPGQFTLDWVPTLDQGIAALRAGKHDVYLVDYLLGPDNGLDRRLPGQGQHRRREARPLAALRRRARPPRRRAGRGPPALPVPVQPQPVPGLGL
jgi:CheY-like chemotaxis protein